MTKLYTKTALFLSIFSTSFIQAQTITTIAGTGTAGYNGDNIAATVAQLNGPAGVTVDNSGNIFIADFLGERVRKVSTTGFITTVAGTGSTGYNGDNIAATIASFRSPTGPAVDASGNIYVIDGNNNRIRKISTNGIISTIAGTGVPGYNGDNIAAATAQLNFPTNGILIDPAGNIIFSDSYNNRIRKISTNGIITTIAGTGVAGYNGDNIAATAAQINIPYGLQLDAAGNLYFTDTYNNRVRKISPSGIISTVAGNGSSGFGGDNGAATSALLYRPIGVAVDGAGNVFIADTYNHRIRKVSTTGIITTIAGTNFQTYNGDNILAVTANLSSPNGIKLDALGNLLIAELGGNRIRRISNAGIPMPLTLTSFSAQLRNGTGFLQWETNDEVNTKEFVVESSKDGRLFSDVGKVDANNSSGIHAYSYTDMKVQNGVTYYRLRMIDKDGRFTYSNTVSIKFNTLTINLSLSPNPTSYMFILIAQMLEKQVYKYLM